MDPTAADREEMKTWLGYDKAIELFGPDLDGDVNKVILQIAREFFRERCEWCEGTGMTNAHDRIVFWESEIAKKFNRKGASLDKLALAKVAAKLLPIEFCGICKGTTVRTVSVMDVLGPRPKGVISGPTAAKKAKPTVKA